MIPFEAVSQVPSLFASAQTGVSSLIKIAPVLIEKVGKIVAISVPIFQSVYTLGFGVAGIISSYKSQNQAENLLEHKEKVKKEKIISPKKQNYLQKRISHHNTNTIINLVAGILFIGAGVTGTFIALHELEVIAWESEIAIMQPISTSMFLAGCALSLYQYTEQLITTVKTLKRDDLTDDEREYHNKMLLTSILGIISNIGYCFVGVATFLNFIGATIFIIGLLSMLIGSGRAIYEMLFVKNPEEIHV